MSSTALMSDSGNALNWYEREELGIVAIQEMLRTEPEAAPHVALINFDDAGMPVGAAITAEEIGAANAMPRIWCDWNNGPESGSNHRGIWRLVDSRDGSLMIDFPQPENGAEVAIGSEEDWWAGRVIDADYHRHGCCLVAVDFSRPLPMADTDDQ